MVLVADVAPLRFTRCGFSSGGLPVADREEAITAGLWSSKWDLPCVSCAVRVGVAGGRRRWRCSVGRCRRKGPGRKRQGIMARGGGRLPNNGVVSRQHRLDRRIGDILQDSFVPHLAIDEVLLLNG